MSTMDDGDGNRRTSPRFKVKKDKKDDVSICSFSVTVAISGFSFSYQQSYISDVLCCCCIIII